MLGELHDDLARRNVQLLMARDVGDVRDVLRTADGDPSLRHVYPTVRRRSRRPQAAAAEPRTTQRKPRCDVEVSGVSLWRAAGR